jgi:hypothetical protein
MTAIAPSYSAEPIELDAFVEHLERDLHVVDADSLAAAAPAFGRLINNPRLLHRFIESELAGWRSGRSDHEYVNHTLVLVRRPAFMIRANVWVAPDPQKPPPNKDDLSFGYLYPHDHNFAFLTGGYHGPGYTTFLFEYDHDAVAGYPGEHVELTPRGRAGLPRGAVMLYRPSQDIHYQEHPTALSISINVIVSADYTERAQFLFDVESQTVDRVLAPATAAATTLCELAAEIGDGRIEELLADVASHASAARVRVAAAAALGAGALHVLCSDPQPHVRVLAERALAGVGVGP